MCVLYTDGYGNAVGLGTNFPLGSKVGSAGRAPAARCEEWAAVALRALHALTRRRPR